MSLPERIVFFGTPEFALPTLDALAAAGSPPGWVVSQPDRPVGRGRKMEAPPVARWAAEHGVALAQPQRVKSGEFLGRVREWGPDVAVVVAFGQIFPQSLLDLPRLGCINLHGSLLPSYRGAAPIQAAIAAGDRLTGVTTMVMEKGLDSGPTLLERRLEIGLKETSEELAPRLAELGGALMVETLRRLQAGEIEPQRQDDALATYAGRITKTDGQVDWSLTANQLFDRLRAYIPWPGLTASLGQTPLKILSAEPLEMLVEDGLETEFESGPDDAPPGTILAFEASCWLVRCGYGTVLALERCQRPGRKPVTAMELARGEHVEPGNRFD